MARAWRLRSSERPSPTIKRRTSKGTGASPTEQGTEEGRPREGTTVSLPYAWFRGGKPGIYPNMATKGSERPHHAFRRRVFPVLTLIQATTDVTAFVEWAAPPGTSRLRLNRKAARSGPPSRTGWDAIGAKRINGPNDYFRSASASSSSCKICALSASNRASAGSLNSGSLPAVKAEAIAVQSSGFSAFSAAGKKYRSSIII